MTKEKEIQDALHELFLAMTEKHAAMTAEEDAKLRQQKAHKRLLLAREAVHAITYGTN